MMGGANIPARAPPMAGPVPLAVISPQFCAGYPVNLAITGKLMTSANGTFGVTDFNGNIIFTVKSKVFSLHARRVLLDSAGNPIITFQQKMISAHRRWKAFRGESTDAKDLLFNVKKSSMFRSKRKLDVFLAANTAEEICDFKIDGNWSEGSCVICAGNANNIIAQVYRFMATVNPNIDYAFIVALIFILDEINSSDGGGADGDHGGGGDGYDGGGGDGDDGGGGDGGGGGGGDGGGGGCGGGGGGGGGCGGGGGGGG